MRVFSLDWSNLSYIRPNHTCIRLKCNPAISHTHTVTRLALVVYTLVLGTVVTLKVLFIALFAIVLIVPRYHLVVLSIVILLNYTTVLNNFSLFTQLIFFNA